MGRYITGERGDWHAAHTAAHNPAERRAKQHRSHQHRPQTMAA